jgi:hypothetical protein
MAAAHPDPTPAEPDAAPVAAEPDAAPLAAEPDAAPLNRRERRAAARGGTPTTQKVHGPAGGVLTPPPARKRNYAARKGG